MDDLRTLAERGYEGAASTDHDQQAQAVSLFITDMLRRDRRGTMWPGSSHAPAMASALGRGGLIGRPASIRLSHPAERLAVGKCHARTLRGLSGGR